MLTDRQGIEVDYCPKCRGVWLDRGELDNIIERSATPVPPPTAQPRYAEERRDERKPYGSSNQGYYKKKKGSVLGELFDC